MLPIVAVLLEQGLSLIGNAVMAKGKDWVKEKTGVDMDKASLNQEDFLKLRQYEMDHEEELIRLKQEDNKLAASIEMSYLADTQSARELQKAALAQDDLYSKRFLYRFATGWSIASIAYIGFITFGYIPPENIRFADTILGFVLGVVLAGMFGYFFGSSKSSSAKDSVIKTMVEKGVK